MAIALESKPRPEGSKPKALRRSGLIPANLYGHKGIESIALVLDAKVVERLLKQVTPNKTEIELSIPELEWTGTTVIRELQLHPAKGTPYHLSFFAGAKG
ncbi:50S ribosomal protein L25 [Dolichospermum sp. UHCC 0259]|uniref:50S ribosomal protein L25 n=1 Tax=Dolichospermum sp. UHCC 0259 TaxID=2590010 RepID=UPI001444CAE2|nr:50S ribosomal protein L25 [Dolichospermum sp. UHCC 0259]MTJ49025.1 50S ribosomal protein L25 [Dolichospermum sp. UHCC 0259]